MLLVAAAAAGCASAGELAAALDRAAGPPGLRFGLDTFAFPNESETKNAGKTHLYASNCFVMAKGVRQFHQFARFDPTAPRLDSAAYEALVRRVVARPPWAAPLPEAERVVIPGFTSLRELSVVEEDAVKRGLGSAFWTWVHWTNWRVAFPMPHAQQERVAAEVVAELGAGRPVQLLVTNLPVVEMNHTVVAYDYYLTTSGDVEFVVYDPNDPQTPGLMTFDRTERRFVSTRIYDTRQGPMRAFRMYYGPLL